MSTEKIAVSIPGKGSFIFDLECHPTEGDDEIAARIAKQFPPGTIFNVSGSKWMSLSKTPPRVIPVEGEPHTYEALRAKHLGEGRSVPLDMSDHADAVRPQIAKLDHEKAKAVAEAPTLVVGRPTRAEVVEAARAPVVRPEGLPPSEPHKVSEPVAYKPGQVWKPKDPRRKSGFTIKAVTATEVVADDGRTVQLERMKRYEKVS